MFELVILNGMCKGDEDGRYTFMSPTRSSVFDYFLVSPHFLKRNMHLTVVDQTLSHHLPVELSISSNAYNVNAMGCVEQKRVTKVVWDEEKKDTVIQVSRSEDAVNLLKEATCLITYDLEGTIDIFTSSLSHISQRMKKKQAFCCKE